LSSCAWLVVVRHQKRGFQDVINWMATSERVKEAATNARVKAGRSKPQQPEASHRLYIFDI
jgi:hypothetical protein